MSSSPTRTTTYMWDYPQKAHNDYALAEAERESLLNTLGSPLSGPESFVIPYSAQIAVTQEQHPAEAVLFGTHLKKAGATIDPPPDSNQLSMRWNPWIDLFGSSANLDQQVNVLAKFSGEQIGHSIEENAPGEEVLSAGGAHYIDEDRENLPPGDISSKAEELFIEENTPVEEVFKENLPPADISSNVVDRPSQEATSINIETPILFKYSPHIDQAALSKEIAALNALLKEGIKPRQELLNEVQNRMGSIRQG